MKAAPTVCGSIAAASVVDFCFAFASCNRVLTDSLLALTLGKGLVETAVERARCGPCAEALPSQWDGLRPGARCDSNGRDIFAPLAPKECCATLGALVAERPRPVWVTRLRVDADFAAGHNPIEPGADAI